MSRYAKTFERLRQRAEGAFIPFAMAGDPDIDLSERICKTYIDNGADILEIGYPFSDPIADGAVNQRAAQRAIRAGITPARFFDSISRLRDYAPDTPFGLLCYANTLYRYGYEPFCRDAAQAGMDSVLVADCPPGEAPSLHSALSRHGLECVFIVSELTPDVRIQKIAEVTGGFIYVVSRLGPTGTHAHMDSKLKRTLSRIRRYTSLPLCVGFGISTPRDVEQVLSAGADGAIVGSALVQHIEHYNSVDDLCSKFASHIRTFKKATRQAE
jgi:tryptophan synthase alpha chain